MATANITATTTSPRSNQWVNFLRNNASILLIYGLIFLVGGVASIYSDNFRTASNMANILRQTIILGLLAIGQSMVILTGGMDMSIAQITRTVVLVVATIFNLQGSDPSLILPLVLLGITIGAVLGGLNGVLITSTHANSFIITFGMASLLRGVNLAISSTPIRGVPDVYLNIYTAKIGIIPVNVLLMAVIWFLIYLFSTRTCTGRGLYAVGGSERVARWSAIKFTPTVVAGYVLSGFFAALAGLFILARTGVGDPSAAEGMDFQSVVAVAVGGISLYGGRGSMIGTLGGVLLLTLISNVFNLLQVNIYYQQLILGLIVLIAVAAYKSPRSV